MSSITRCRSVEPDAWNRLINDSGAAARFSQRAEAAVALERAFPEYSRHLLDVEYEDGARILVPSVLARRRLSVLSSVLAMPLGWDGTPIELQGQFQLPHIKALARRLRPTGEFRLHGGFLRALPSGARSTAVSRTHVLELSGGFSAVWEKRFTAKNRNTCRKAERGGVAVERVEPRRASGLYYGLYARATREWGYATPPYPRTLFDSLGASGRAEFWLGFRGEEVVSGAVFLVGSEDVFYWSGAMDRAVTGLSPSNLVLKVAIEDACRRGFRYVDFGASEGLPLVRKFKESFGAQAISCASIRLVSGMHIAASAVVRLLKRRR